MRFRSYRSVLVSERQHELGITSVLVSRTRRQAHTLPSKQEPAQTQENTAGEEQKPPAAQTGTSEEKAKPSNAPSVASEEEGERGTIFDTPIYSSPRPTRPRNISEYYLVEEIERRNAVQEYSPSPPCEEHATPHGALVARHLLADSDQIRAVFGWIYRFSTSPELLSAGKQTSVSSSLLPS